MSRAPRQHRRPRYRPIPTLESGASPEDVPAFFDQILIRLSDCRFSYSSRETFVGGFLALITQRDLFRSTGRRNQYRLNTTSDWLFSASIVFPGIREGQVLRNRFRIEIRLNPTRFLSHHNLTAEEIRGGDAREILRKNEARESEIMQLTLDRNDNLLTPDRWWRNGREMLDATNAYIEKVQELIEDEFSQFSDPLPQNTDSDEGPDWDTSFEINQDNWTVNRTEIYWEYRVPSALVNLRQLRLSLLALFNSVETVDYGVPPPRSDPSVRRGRTRTHHNAWSIEVPLRDGVSLMIYAKTYDRLRFEVRYQKNLRTLLNPSFRSEAVSSDYEGLFSALRVAVDDATTRVSRILPDLQEITEPEDPSFSDLATLMGILVETAEAAHISVTRLLELLCVNGAITVGNDNNLSSAVDLLVRSRVLERSRAARRQSPRRFVVADQWISTIEALANAYLPSEEKQSL
jgi:hypothetical protein